MIKMNRSKVGVIALFALAAIGVPLLYAGIRKLASFDPFAQFAGKWSDPFGNNTGSVMEKVDVSLYEGSNKTVSFHANRLTIRRDKQHMQLELISNGKILDKGKPTAGFEAGLATYDVPNEHVDVAGGAVLTSKDYSFKTASLQIDRKKKTIQANRGLTGTYR